MKKNLTKILIAVVFSLTLIVYLLVNSHSPVEPPERRPNIPEQAEWVGGGDGGAWYQIVKVISKRSFVIKIYHDFSGDIVANDTFELNHDCLFDEIDSITLAKSFNAFDGEKIGLILPKNQTQCFLLPK